MRIASDLARIYPFDMSKLPSKSFNPLGFKAVPKAPVRPFYYNQLPDTLFNLDHIPSQPLISKTSLIGNIKKTNLGFPRLRADSYQTFFQYGDETGIAGQGVVSLLHARKRTMVDWNK